MVLTAGHCFYTPAYDTWWNPWVTKTYDASASPVDSVHAIGSRSNSTNGTTDAGVLAIPNLSGWNPEPWVLVRDSQYTVGNGGYTITGVGTSGGLPINYMLCVQGAVLATRCGGYKGIGNSNGSATNLGLVDVWSCSGDSGGPVIKGGLGYGIDISTETAAPVKDLTIGIGPACDGICGGGTYYQGLRT